MASRSEYDPFLDHSAPDDDDLDRVRDRFALAAQPFVRSPWSWLAWSLILPAAALATPHLLQRLGAPGALLAWSVAVLLGGAIELAVLRGATAGEPISTLARWAFRAQGNLSLVAVALSAAVALRWPTAAELLPGLWLLLLGHSFFVLGGLAFPPLRRTGLLYQAGGFIALWPAVEALPTLAVTTGAANLYMAWSVARRRRG